MAYTTSVPPLYTFLIKYPFKTLHKIQKNKIKQDIPCLVFHCELSNSVYGFITLIKAPNEKANKKNVFSYYSCNNLWHNSPWQGPGSTQLQCLHSKRPISTPLQVAQSRSLSILTFKVLYLSRMHESCSSFSSCSTCSSCLSWRVSTCVPFNPLELPRMVAKGVGTC